MYPDEDNDGIVDGTVFSETDLVVLRIDPATGAVLPMHAILNTQENLVCLDLHSSGIPVVAAKNNSTEIIYAIAVSSAASGDVNFSGNVDAIDVQMTINAALGLAGIYSCDINRNFAVDAIDVQLVINAALGLMR